MLVVRASSWISLLLAAAAAADSKQEDVFTEHDALDTLFHLPLRQPGLGGSTLPSAAAADLQQRLQDAATAGVPIVRIPAGDYRFGNANLALTSASNMQIVFEPGATLWFNYSKGFNISNSTNLTVTGGTIDYDPPCFAQGVVTAVGPGLGDLSKEHLNASELEAVFDPSFVMPDNERMFRYHQARVKIGFWEPKLLQLQELHDGPKFAVGAQRIGTALANADRFQAVIAAAAAYNSSMRTSPAEGHSASHKPAAFRITTSLRDMKGVRPYHSLVAIFGRAGLTFHLDHCTNVTTQSLRVHGGGNMAVTEFYGYGGHVHKDLKLIRRPGASPVRLLTSNADGFHSTSLVKGTVLTHSTISHCGDDAYNSHNFLQILFKHEGERTLYVLDTDQGNTLAVLEKSWPLGGVWSRLQVHEFRRQTYDPIFTEVAVVGIARDSDPSILQAAELALQQLRSMGVATMRNTAHFRVFRVAIADPLPASFPQYALINYGAVATAGAMVLHSRLTDAYDRALNFKGQNGVVAHNFFARAGQMCFQTSITWLVGPLDFQNVAVLYNRVQNVEQPQFVSRDGVSFWKRNITFQGNKCFPDSCQESDDPGPHLLEEIQV